MARWVEIRKGADFRAIGEKFQISPLTARLIRNKDITGEQEIKEYLHGTLEDLHPASLMKGIPEAVELLRKKLRNTQPSGLSVTMTLMVCVPPIFCSEDSGRQAHR